MEFKRIIENIPIELVERWWRDEAPTTAPAQNEGTYYLEKDGKELPFKYVVVEVARKAGHELSVGDFASESSKRALFADRFGFRIEEKLGYNNTELADLQRLHAGLRDPVSFKKFLGHANHLVKAIGIAPYVIRMALPERACLLELGARAILRYRELPSGIEVKFMLRDEDVKQLDMALSPEVERFRPTGSSWVTLHFHAWADVPPILLEQNEQAVRVEYERVKDFRLSEIRLGSKTTNSALKYAVYQNADIPTMRTIRKTSNINGEASRYWIFQANPKWYDAIGALRDNAVDRWSVPAHKQSVTPGDKVIIWVTGAEAGCYALATVVSAVQPMPIETPSYSTDPDTDATQDRVRVTIDHNLWNHPILKAVVEEAEVGLKAGGQGTTFSATKSNTTSFYSGPQPIRPKQCTT